MSGDSIDETVQKHFETAWVKGTPEPIERLLPPENDPKYLATLEELVHIELEFAWKSWFQARKSFSRFAASYGSSALASEASRTCLVRLSTPGAPHINSRTGSSTLDRTRSSTLVRQVSSPVRSNS